MTSNSKKESMQSLLRQDCPVLFQPLLLQLLILPKRTFYLQADAKSQKR